MNYKKLSTGKNPPFEVNILVEIPKGCWVKYEFDKAAECLFVDRLVASPTMPYPGNYGFIPHTLADDGDPLDIVTWDVPPLEGLSVMAVRPVGVLIMEDEKGRDEKIIAVPVDSVSAKFRDVQDLADIPQEDRDGIEYFFSHYKDLSPGRKSKTYGWGDAKKAQEIILDAIAKGKQPQPGTP